MKTQNKENRGDGHKAKIVVDLKSTVEIDGKKTSFNINYDLNITFEQVDYAVRAIAGGIAQAASAIARDGLDGVRGKAKKAAAHSPVTA